MIVVNVAISLDCSSACSTPVRTVEVAHRAPPGSAASAVRASCPPRLPPGPHRARPPCPAASAPSARRRSRMSRRRSSSARRTSRSRRSRTPAPALAPRRRSDLRAAGPPRRRRPRRRRPPPPPLGQRPSTRLSGLKRSYSGAVSMPKANDGAPPVSIGSPSGRSSFVWKSCTDPVATSTPSTSRTRSSVSSGTGGASADSPSKLKPGSFPVTTASVPAYESTKIASNALSIVSVRTYAPLIIATPSTIASAVSAVRSLRPARLFSAKRIIVLRLYLRPAAAMGSPEYSVWRRPRPANPDNILLKVDLRGRTFDTSESRERCRDFGMAQAAAPHSSISRASLRSGRREAFPCLLLDSVDRSSRCGDLRRNEPCRRTEHQARRLPGRRC